MEGELQAISDEKKETIARVEATAAEYIKKSLKELHGRETRYQWVVYGCYFLCFLSLLVCLIFLIDKGTTLITADISISRQIQLGILGVVVLALIISLARFSFLMGKSFMVESLRNLDRIHAISFGEFYLQAFGDKAEWSEVKEAFQHWNIDKGSIFITQNANEFDPDIFKNIIEFTKLITTKTVK